MRIVDHPEKGMNLINICDYLNHFCTDDLCQNRNLQSVDSLPRLYHCVIWPKKEHHMRHAQKNSTNKHSQSSILFYEIDKYAYL